MKPRFVRWPALPRLQSARLVCPSRAKGGLGVPSFRDGWMPQASGIHSSFEDLPFASASAGGRPGPRLPLSLLTSFPTPRYYRFDLSCYLQFLGVAVRYPTAYWRRGSNCPRHANFPLAIVFYSRPPAATFTGSGTGTPLGSALLNFPHAPVECPLPFVNLKDDGGIFDLNQPPHFSRRVHGAPRLVE